MRVKKNILFTVITKICNHSNVYVRRSLVAWTCVRSKAHATKGLSGFCTSFKTTNDFPVIGDLVMRTGLWDRQGANIASRYKEMYGVELFLR